MRRGRLVMLLCFILAPPAAAQGPSADWRSLETANFRIHYPASFEATARHVAASIESIHARVTGLVGFAPEGPIEIVVADPAADPNGFAIPFLDRPEMALWSFPPESESSVGDFADWMEVVAAHEDVHIVHLARPGGSLLSRLLRFSPVPVGPLVLEAPRWVIEGYATLAEGALTGSGRPGSAYRAMILRQFAIEGKLPAYAKLDSRGGWTRGAMAYLVGSAYLEWLAARQGPESLPKLWTRMAAGSGFVGAFREVFGEPPRDLYEKFTAGITARALEEKRVLEAAGLAEGSAWATLDGATSAPQVSPDGARLLARRDPDAKESFLAIWELPGLEPRWRLPRADGYSAADPRFLPDGRSVLLSRRAPQADGTLRWDLWRWDYESGGVERVTRGADVFDADPSPDARFAVGVRNRFGSSALVRVGLATGEIEEIAVAVPAGDPWRVWSHPRLSPDGSRIAVLLHREGRWRLATLPAEGGAVREIELPGSPSSAPAWSPDGTRLFVTTDASGIWNLAAVDLDSGVSSELTRVTGGAFSPAPSPDGRELFFLSLTSRGVDLNRLALDGRPPIAPAASPPNAAAAPAFSPGPVPAPRSYSVWPSFAVRPLLNFSIGPDGDTVQLGAEGDDVLHRLHVFAAGSFGNAPGPRGAGAAAAWRGMPVAITLQLFSAIEKPGSQSLVERPALDEQRTGGFLGFAWGRRFTGGRVQLEGGGGSTRVEALSDGSRFWRSLGSARGALSVSKTRGRWGAGLGLDVSASAGSTGGSGWSQIAGGGRVSGITPWGTLSAGARRGGMGGSPTDFDVFSIGGAPSLILPEGLDRNRIESPALPQAVQLGESFESFRAELAAEAAPVVLYGEWLRAWSAGQPRPDRVRAVGGELRLERLIPSELGRPLTLRLGGAWITSESPEFRTVRGYAALLYRL